MEEPQIRYCTTSDGVSIAYYVMGEGPPVVSTSNIWGSHLLLLRNPNRPNYERLERDDTVVRYDGRGSGLSQRKSPDFSLSCRLLDLEAVVEHVGLDRFALLGGLHGGLAAVAYAARHPERVTHLILVNAYASGRDLFAASPSMRAKTMLPTATPAEWEFYTLTFATEAYRSDAEGAKERAALFRASMEPDAMLAFRDVMVELDVTDLLPQIRIPALVLCRPSREHVQPEMSQTLASRIPGARLIVLAPRTGTGLDEELLRAYSEFLGDAAPADEAAAAATASAPAAPTGMVVVLFTDIVDSTALTERLGDTVFRTASRALDEGVRAAMRDAGGTPVEGKVLGDGVMGVFPTAAQAIAAARRCIELSAESELQLHVGLHAGDVLHEAGNVYGGAVNIASRICGESAPGEVLVSATVRDLARTSAGVTFADRGKHELKGIDDAVRLYEVRWQA